MNTLYISDLDGTLLDNNASLSPHACQSLASLIEDGLHFSVASARSISSIRTMLEGLPLRLPVIEFNGAFISDLDTGHHHIVNAIQPEVARALYALKTDHNCRPFISTFNGRDDRMYHHEPNNEGMHWYLRDRIRMKDSRLRSLESARDSLREQVICLTSIGEQAPLTALAARVEEQFGEHVETHLFENQYSPGWYWFTVHDRRATKDQAIRALMQAQGLEASDLVVFGDNTNDLKMFDIATESVAVANAVQAVKDRATHVIGPNEADSVVEFIRSHSACGPVDGPFS